MTQIDLNLFMDMLSFDSTSGQELELARFLEKKLAEPVAGRSPRVQCWNVAEGVNAGAGGGRNLLFSWGEPRVVFCTHIDTVPPFIPPTIIGASSGEMSDGQDFKGATTIEGVCVRGQGVCVRGRGACDAKGQIAALYAACKTLAQEGYDGFGLLLLSGEETGSWGAKAFAQQQFSAPYLIIGEPTEGKMVSAAKGTKNFKLTFTGTPFHSGYPQFGHSAIDAFVDFVNALRGIEFAKDPVLGDTTWNIGRLSSDNPQNVLSPQLTCNLYFRTTFATDTYVSKLIPSMAKGLGALEEMERGDDEEMMDRGDGASKGFGMSVEAIGGDAPAEYFTIPGFESAPVAFGSDAPHLANFTHRAICGPGSIRYAHTADEQITLKELEEAATNYVAMFKALQ